MINNKILFKFLKFIKIIVMDYQDRKVPEMILIIDYV